MGVKGLWNLLTPYCEKKPLHEIRGETLAVDLSGWICDSQNVTEYHAQPKLYLRTIYLVLADIYPIFVLEGDAPELKRDVIASRNATRYGAAGSKSKKSNGKPPDVSRKQFRRVLNECESLLKCMGVRCIKGRGEAEATCAEMNAQKLVDAVVSQDSDCFAYGAKRVYRNFSVANSGGGGGLQGSVDCYDADVMFQSNGFGRNKMVALALLCGCDYGVGACGLSLTTVTSFLHTVPEADIIPRLMSWVSEPERYEEKARWVSVPGRCDRCGHAGRTHLRSGCPVCATHQGCHDYGHKSKVSEVKKELSLRSRALSSGIPFPEPKVMKEFLRSDVERIDVENLKTPAPSLIQFVKLMTNKLDWSERYCVAKFLPLLTKWHLQDNVPVRTIRPVAIKKKRNPKGVPSFEVVWEDIDGLYESLISDEQFEEGEDPHSPWTSIERQDLIRRYYPTVVEEFEMSQRKPVKEKKSRSKKANNAITKVDKPKRTRKNNKNVISVKDKSTNESYGVRSNDDRKQNDISIINVSVKVNKLKRKIKDSKTKGQRTIDSYIADKRRKSEKKLMHSLRQSFKNMSFGESKNEIDKENQNDDRYFSILNATAAGDDDEGDLSDIIDKIVTQAPTTKTTKLENNFVKLLFENKFSTPKKSVMGRSILNEIHDNCSTPNASPIRKFDFKFSVGSTSNLPRVNRIDTSYFFDKLTEEKDAFELSIDYSHCDDNRIDSEATINYSLLSSSLPDVQL